MFSLLSQSAAPTRARASAMTNSPAVIAFDRLSMPMLLQRFVEIPCKAGPALRFTQPAGFGPANGDTRAHSPGRNAPGAREKSYGRMGAGTPPPPIGDRL